jgi:hypothetical protein
MADEGPAAAGAFEGRKKNVKRGRRGHKKYVAGDECRILFGVDAPRPAHTFAFR